MKKSKILINLRQVKDYIDKIILINNIKEVKLFMRKY